MTTTLDSLLPLICLAAEAPGHAAHAAGPVARSAGSDLVLTLLIPAFPLLSAILCGVCAALRVRSRLPGFLTVALLAASFACTLMLWLGMGGPGPVAKTAIAHGFEWINFAWGPGKGQSIAANVSFYTDSLTLLWMLFVTGLAALIALYSTEYMAGDAGPGYCRYFAYFGLFVLAMTCLVMGDNLLLLYLGWEGVGLCSYLLIGYFYTKPAAVAAAKKAFILNRIGDLGLALGVMTTFVTFGTLEYAPLFEMFRAGVDGAGHQLPEWVRTWLPIMFMVGAFGKSAQLFFYVWLPDAMEGPTPVSALIHAATMVTAGVYLIARLYPLFLLDEARTALTIVAWSGAITALWAATIGMAVYDIKRIMGYSTASQLGFMFAGLGVLTSAGAAFHVFTHAFFKATLFLSCGAVMHGFAGQLDLRKLSGVMKIKGFGLVGLAMLIGGINLAGVPLTAGFFSKDMILAQAFATKGSMIPGSHGIGWILLATAGLTAYYTFRAFFRVFLGPVHFQPGDELHGHGAGEDHGHGHGHAHADHDAHAKPLSHGDHDDHAFHPHPPGWAVNTVLAVCATLSILAAGAYFVGGDHGWVGMMVHHSTAAFASPGEHGDAHAGRFLGMDPHEAMYYVSGGIGAIGIAIAYALHLAGRTTADRAAADKLVPALGPVARWARNKWYVDEFYDFLIRKPLWVLANLFHLVDRLLVDGLVDLFGLLPRGIASGLRPSQNGVLQSYAAGMAGGLAFVLLIVWVLL